MQPSPPSSIDTTRPPRLMDPVRWAFYGAVLGLGAPLGLHLLLSRFEASSRAELVRVVYWYVAVSTSLTFSIFGVLAGRMMARLRAASTHDPLTGLANRRLLLGQFPSLLSNRERRGEALCVLMLDLDHFKRVNDNYGHAVGDKTLVALSKTILSDVRQGDLVARYGGEEFVVVCPAADEEAGSAIAERIRESVAALGEDELGFDGVQTISIGLCCTRSSADTPASLLKRADAALYEAKSRGRDRVCIDRGGAVFEDA